MTGRRRRPSAWARTRARLTEGRDERRETTDPPGNLFWRSESAESVGGFWGDETRELTATEGQRGALTAPVPEPVSAIDETRELAAIDVQRGATTVPVSAVDETQEFTALGRRGLAPQRDDSWQDETRELTSLAGAPIPRDDIGRGDRAGAPGSITRGVDRPVAAPVDLARYAGPPVPPAQGAVPHGERSAVPGERTARVHGVPALRRADPDATEPSDGDLAAVDGARPAQPGRTGRSRRNETQGPSRNGTHGPSQDEALGVGRDETRGVSRHGAAAASGEHAAEPGDAAPAVPRPLYARALFLRNVDPGPILCFLFFEGSLALGAAFALAGLVDWWAVLVLPVTVAAMVKLNDVVAGSSQRRGAGAPAVHAAHELPHRHAAVRSDPVKEAHLEWRRGLRSELRSAGLPTDPFEDDVASDRRSRGLPRDW
jgi:hypothetical protein